MTKFYSLENSFGQILGVFTTPELAITHAYLSQIYQWYRGYSRKLDKYIWRDDRGVNWYAYIEADGIKEPKDRGRAVFEIHTLTVDMMPPCEDRLRDYAKDEELPNQSDLHIVLPYLDEVNQ